MQIKKIILANLLCFMSTPLFASADWSTHYGNAARTSSLPIVTHPESYHVAWEMPYADAINSSVDMYGPIIADSKIFFTLQTAYNNQTFHKVTTLNVNNGVQLWEMYFDTIVHSPFYQDGKLLITEYIDAYQSHLVALRNDKAKILYDNKLPDNTNSITPDGQTAYLNIDNIKLGGYDTTFGELSWVEKVSPGRHFDSAFAVSKDFLVAKSFDGFMVFNRKNGKEAFKYLIDNTLFDSPTKRYSVPVINPRTQIAYALFADDDLENSGKLKKQATLYALDLQTQTLKWKLLKQTYKVRPALTGNLIFSVDVDFSKLNTIDNNTGSVLWFWSPPTDDHLTKESVIVATADVVFISAAKRVYAISLATHQVIFAYDATARSLALGEGKLFIIHNRINPFRQYLITAIALY